MDAAEVGCQFFLTTGKHIGPCLGTCTEIFVSKVEYDLEAMADSGEPVQFEFHVNGKVFSLSCIVTRVDDGYSLRVV